MEHMHSKDSNIHNIPENCVDSSNRDQGRKADESVSNSKSVRNGNENYISRKKQRPNYIALPGTILGELQGTGEVDDLVEGRSKTQQTKESDHEDGLNGNSASNNLEHSNLKQDHSDVNKEQTTTQSSKSEAMSEKPPISKDTTTGFLAKLSSRIISADGKVSSPCDSVSSLDSIPWNMEGTETIVENPAKRSKIANTTTSMENKRLSFIERELDTIREENKQLKGSLEEAGRLNAQWRSYHQERQGYVEKLLSTIHSLQQRQLSPPNAQLKASATGGSAEEVKKLKEVLVRVQAEHQEHVALLQMQVRAHQDDWEAESAEKKLERTGREEAEERAALLLQEVQHLQQQLIESEKRRHLCSRCCGPVLPPNKNSYQVKQDTDGKMIGQNNSLKNTLLKGYPAPNLHLNRYEESKINGKSRQSNNHPNQQYKQITNDKKQTSGALVPTPDSTDRAAIHPSRPPQKQQYHSYFGHILQAANQSKQMSREDHAERVTREIANLNPFKIAIDNQPDTHMEKNANGLLSSSSGHENNCLNGKHQKKSSGGNRNLQKLDSAHENKSHSNSDRPTRPVNKYSNAERVMHAETKYPVCEKEELQKGNAQLKGWIPVSMIHQIAFGSSGDRSSMQQNNENQYNDTGVIYYNEQFPYQDSPSLSKSRESSLLSCTSSEGQNPQPDSSRWSGALKHASESDTVGARPKYSNNKYSKRTEDDQKNARHRARNILTNALPMSPSSSGPSTLGGFLAKPNTVSSYTNHGIHHNPGSQSYATKILNFGSINPKSSMENDTVAAMDNMARNNQKDNKKEADTAKEVIVASGISKTIQGVTKDTIRESKSQEKESSRKISDSTETSFLMTSATISTSTSNETSRSSSPGMSLTTFALDSDGKGIPGAICFSLHPDIQPCINTEILSAIDRKSPKNELTISRVQIEPRSPKLSRSPIEISTKEHWWSVGDRESTTDDKSLTTSGKTLINSTVVKLQETTKKDHIVDQQRTARAIPNQEIVHCRRQQQSENELKHNNYQVPYSKHHNSCDFPIIKKQQEESNRKTIASKNIASAIISYEIAAKGDKIIYSDRLKENDNSSALPRDSKFTNPCPDGVATLTSKEIVCPTCQMLFSKDQHIMFLDHFETCKGPEFADL